MNTDSFFKSQLTTEICYGQAVAEPAGRLANVDSVRLVVGLCDRRYEVVVAVVDQWVAEYEHGRRFSAFCPADQAQQHKKWEEEDNFTSSLHSLRLWVILGGKPVRVWALTCSASELLCHEKKRGLVVACCITFCTCSTTHFCRPSFHRLHLFSCPGILIESVGSSTIKLSDSLTPNNECER